MDPDLTRTIRFPPPNRSTGAKAVEKPPPPPPSGLWWQQDKSGSEPPASAPARGHFEMWNPPSGNPWSSPGEAPEEDDPGVWHDGEPEAETEAEQGPVLPDPATAAASPPQP
ncbi:hypothetical protein ETD85_09540, partial [Nonomuraea zeae]